MKAFGLVSLLLVLAIAGYLMIGGGDGNGGPAADSQLGQAKAAWPEAGSVGSHPA